MRMIVSLDLAKEAFKDKPNAEVARLFRNAASAAEILGVDQLHGIALYDIDGEKVGLIDVIDDNAKPQAYCKDGAS